MVDEPVIAKVIEVDRSRNRLIMSERAATREARDALKERLIEELEPGEVRSGHVISLADFGAFVDIGGADGLVHLSEVSWKRVSHPREVLKVGQKVDVKVLGVDKERKRISLSIRELEANPWDEIVKEFEEGQLVEGTITKLTDFGAFASLAGTGDYDIEGLIHVSELAEQRVEHPREVVEEGQVVTLRVINIDNSRRRIGLSMKRVSSAEYSEQDWRVAMQDMQAHDSDDVAQSEVEDFDAALEAVDEGLPAVDAEAEAAETSGDAVDETAADETPADELPEPDVEVSAEVQTQAEAAETSGDAVDETAVDETPADELPEPDVEVSAEVQTQAEAAETSGDAVDETAADETPADELPEPDAEVSAEVQTQAEAVETSIDVEVEAEEELEVETIEDEEKIPSVEAEPADGDEHAAAEGAETGGDPPSDDPERDTVATT